MNDWHKTLFAAAIIMLGIDMLALSYKVNLPSIGFGIFHKMDYYDVSLVEVISGNEFVLTLQDGRRIHGILKISAIPAAKNEVMKLINSTHNPKVCLLSENNGVWTVDLVVVSDTSNGPVEIHLATWLREKQLV